MTIYSDSPISKTDAEYRQLANRALAIDSPVIGTVDGVRIVAIPDSFKPKLPPGPALEREDGRTVRFYRM
jgi:hypothetical protein